MKKSILVALLLFMLLLPVLPVLAQQTHIVGPGETLSQIAARYGVTLQSLMTTNNIANANRIFAGQVLIIPPTGGPVQQPLRTYTVQPGDQLRFIAQRFGTTWQAIAAYNNIANANRIYAGQVLTLPPTGGPVAQPPPVQPGRYIVGPGDTLFRIARRYGVSAWAIAQANGILNLNFIFTGQSLVIP